MSDYTWTPCGACLEEADEHPGSRMSLCNECTGKRQTWLTMLMRDRNYRGHLARCVLRMPCDKRCPEKPRQHASYIDPEGDGAIQQYERTVLPVFDQLKRQDFESISAFELLVTQNELNGFKYCSQCVAATTNFPQQNESIRLCSACHAKRSHHISQFYGHMEPYFEVWEANSGAKLESHICTMELDDLKAGMSGKRPDYTLESLILSGIGGGPSGYLGLLAGGAALIGVGVMAFYQDVQRRHNDRVYNETVTHNAVMEEQGSWMLEVAIREYCYKLWQNGETVRTSTRLRLSELSPV